MRAFIVREPFVRKNPLTGKAEMHNRGDIIVESERIADLEDSDHDHHLVETHLPADHEAAARLAPKASDADAAAE